MREVEDMIKFWNYNIVDSFVNTIHFFVHPCDLQEI
jgi:hypothetical protein